MEAIPMTRPNLILSVLSSLVFSSLWGQYEIKGILQDSTGLSLPFANSIVKGSLAKMKVVGNYSLSAGFGRGETRNASVNFNYRRNRSIGRKE